MGTPQMGQQDADRWLANERQEQEQAAEAAFAQLCAALPKIEPTPDFVDRATRAVWRARERRRLARRLARMAASAVVSISGLAIAYWVIVRAGAWIVGTGASLVSRGLVWLVMSIAEGMNWWDVITHVGSSIGKALVTPGSSAVFLALELIAVAALYGLRTLLRGDRGVTESGEAHV